MNIVTLLDSLSTRFGIINEKLKIENSVNNLNINVLLEDTFIKILNIAYGYNLKNTNLLKPNYGAIDAIDENSKVIIQITSTYSKEKIENTIKKIHKAKLYPKGYTLFFFFLSDRKSLQQKSIDSINNLLNGNIKFDINSNLLGYQDIYRQIYHSQNVQQAISIIEILDSIIGIIPSGKSSGFESIAISFHERDIDNVYFIVDYLIRTGINVFISSKKLYSTFEEKVHRQFDYLILVTKDTDLSHLKNYIVVLSNAYIEKNLVDSNIECILLSESLKNDSHIQIVSFHKTLMYNNIKLPSFRNWKPISLESLDNYLESILNSFFSTNTNPIASREGYQKELEKIYSNFQVNELTNEENTGYSLYELKMRGFSKITIYYLILHENYILHFVTEHFIRNFSSIKNESIKILVPQEISQKTQRRIENVKKSFGIDDVNYIVDHFFDSRFKDIERIPILSISDYINPVIKDKDNTESDINTIINWLNNDSLSPIAIISGQGGVGKTTFCEKLHDVIIKEKARYHVIFIKSSMLLKAFNHIDFNNDNEYDIYKIYEAWYKTTNSISSNIDKESFYINYQLGNILIILDGIDELISTIPSFTLNSFLSNVSKVLTGNSKIIINCRDTYIEEIINYYSASGNKKILNQIEIFDLLPFDKKLAKDYFKNHFERKTTIEQCLKLLDEFVLSNGEKNFIYPPFLLEIVMQFINGDYNESKIDHTFISELLDKDNIDDHIVYKTCNREIYKKREYGFDLNVDKQVEFMIQFACEEKGRIKEEEINDILVAINCKDRVIETAQGLKDHPFIAKLENEYVFRFDFLNSYFKSLKLIISLKDVNKNEIQPSIIKLLSNECKHNSHIAKYLLKKQNILNVQNTKRLLNKLNEQEKNSMVKRAISNLFLIYLNTIKKEPITLRSSLIELFHDDADQCIISNLFLVDIPIDQGFIFDLSGLIFRNTTIENYPDFFRCSFDKDTFFDDTCTINEVEFKYDDFNLISASFLNFDSNIKGDNTLSALLKLKEEGDGTRQKRIVISSLTNFFKCFYSGKFLNNIKSEREININYAQFQSIVGIDKIKFQLKKEGIIEIKSNQIILIGLYNQKIHKFVEEGLNFPVLNDIMDNLIKQIE